MPGQASARGRDGGPVTACPDGRRERWAKLPGGWAIAALSALLLLALRSPQTFTHPQFWAEDGAVFFQGQYLDGAAALVEPYAGYLHLVPRLTALLSASAGAGPAPALYAAASVAVAMWSAATAASVALPFAWLLGAAMFLTPHPGEVFGTITNAQWVMAPVLALCVAAPAPASPIARANQLAFCLLAGLSGPFSIFAAPVALWRGVRDRADRHGLAVCGLVVVAAACQLVVLLQGRPSEGGTALALHVGRAILDRTVGQLANGHATQTGRQLAFDGLVAAAAAVSLRLEATFPRLFAFVAIDLGSTWLVFLGYPEGTLDAGWSADRYFFPSRVVLLWALIFVALRAPVRPAMLGGAALAVIALHDRQWAKAPLPVLPWHREAARIDRGEAARIVINPGVPEGRTPWTVDVPGRGP